MKKIVLTICMALILFTASAQATPTTLIDQGSTWQYAVLNVDLYGDWNSLTYSSSYWDNATNSGQAAFGNYNYYGGTTLTYNTYWAENTDLALQQTFFIAGTLNVPITLSVASDNGFIIFINGQQVAKEMAEGYTTYWEYVLSLGTNGFISPGNNLIQVLTEDHGGITFFDMKLIGDINSVPEPATILLLGLGMMGLAGARRFKK